ncbi:MAG: ANTAR domain-containing protein [Thermoguttaceae bacterium]|nr:ANTAR domain-containing protein [Thermoguttaceae bacterium]
MGSFERVYSALVVSAFPGFNASLPSLFPASRFETIRLVGSLSAAKRAWSERTFDLVAINSPLPDGIGTRFAADVCDSPGAVALMLARPEDCASVWETTAASGVFVLQKPASGPAFANALEWAERARERLRRVEARATSAETKLEEFRLVNRAKRLLVERQGLDEETAHRTIIKTAMDRCVSKGIVAKEIIDKLG